MGEWNGGGEADPYGRCGGKHVHKHTRHPASNVLRAHYQLPHLHRHAPAVGILEHARLEGQRLVQQAAVALGVAAGREEGCMGHP